MRKSTTFKLQSNKHRYSRGMKTLAEVTHVSVCDYVLTVNDDPSTNITEATIALYGESETFYLSIPDDKLQSMIDRLTALQWKRTRALEQS